VVLFTTLRLEYDNYEVEVESNSKVAANLRAADFVYSESGSCLSLLLVRTLADVTDSEHRWKDDCHEFVIEREFCKNG